MTRDFLSAHLDLLWDMADLLAILFGIILIAGFAIARLDGLRLRDAIYFSFITALTVGFGDYIPRTGWARVVAVLLALVGVVLIGILVAVAGQALTVAASEP